MSKEKALKRYRDEIRNHIYTENLDVSEEDLDYLTEDQLFKLVMICKLDLIYSGTFDIEKAIENINE